MTAWSPADRAVSGGRAGPSPTGHSLPGHCVWRQTTSYHLLGIYSGYGHIGTRQLFLIGRL